MGIEIYGILNDSKIQNWWRFIQREVCNETKNALLIDSASLRSF